jgi:hypothetical protein
MPSFVSLLAVARPIPLVPPVIRAVNELVAICESPFLKRVLLRECVSWIPSLARFGGYRGSTSVSTPKAPGWVTFFATAARPRNIHLDRALVGCQHERNINGRVGRGPVSIFLTNRSESVHQQLSPALWHSCSRGRWLLMPPAQRREVFGKSTSAKDSLGRSRFRASPKTPRPSTLTVE